MSLNLNHVTLAGRLTATPELKQTQGGTSVTSFNIAVNRRVQKEGVQNADFIPCVAWGKTAEFVCKYMQKGSAICVTGAIQSRQYEKDGNKRTVIELNVGTADFVESKAPAAAGTPSETDAPDAPAYEETGDDLPF